jgi:D-glycerate 3-kinase
LGKPPETEDKQFRGKIFIIEELQFPPSPVFFKTMRSMNVAILEILRRCTQETKCIELELQQLSTQELLRSQRAQAFAITEINCQKKLEERLELLPQVYPDVLKLCQKLGLQDSDYVLTTLWDLWLPLAIKLVCQHQNVGRTLIQGILGGQGTGKTTLAEIVRSLLTHLGYSSVAISLDDLYKTYADRQKLQQEDDRLIWRGPPGTHDLELGIEVLEKLRQGKIHESIAIPRFDKSAYNGAGDRCKPDLIKPVDIVLFEGWFVGARPIDKSIFENAPAPIITSEDKRFARDINQKLQEYVPLWNQLDRLLVLYPVDYTLSKEWRKEAEHKMIATGKTGMNDEQVDRFVEYFWRSLHPELFITPLINNPDLVNIVIEINADHTPGRVYCPLGN